MSSLGYRQEYKGKTNFTSVTTEALTTEDTTAINPSSASWTLKTEDVTGATQAKNIIITSGGNTDDATSTGSTILMTGGQDGAGGILRLRAGGGGGVDQADASTIDLIPGSSGAAGGIIISGGIGSTGVDNGDVEITASSSGDGTDGAIKITGPDIRIISNGVTYRWPTDAVAGADGTVLGIASGGGTTDATLGWIAN